MASTGQSFDLSNIFRQAAPFLAIVLCSCGPQMKASADGVTARLVTVENTDSGNFTIQRVIANDSPENSNCNDYPNKVITPGASYSATFIVCGPVRKVRIDTDKGSQTLTLGAAS